MAGIAARASPESFRQVVPHVRELAREVLRRRVALARLLGQAPLDDPAQGCGRLGLTSRSAPAPRSGSPPSVSIAVFFWNARFPVAIS